MKIAMCLGSDPTGCLDVVDRMTSAQVLHPTQDYRVYSLPFGAIGVVTSSDQYSAVPLLREGPGATLLCVTGTPMSMDRPLAAVLDDVEQQGYSAGLTQLASLDGPFAAVCWDDTVRKLLIVTDFLGVQPLYETRCDGRWLLATELKGITASGLLSVEMEPAAWGALFSLNHLVANTTTVRGVRRIGPGLTLTYDPTTGETQSESYYEWPAEQAGLKLKDIDTGQVLDPLVQQCRACGELHEDTTLLLSGGFDSRLVLCALRRAGMPTRVLTREHADENDAMDSLLAAEVARRTQTDMESISLPDDFFSSADYLDFLEAEEVVCRSLYLFGPSLYSAIGPHIRSVWDGTMALIMRVVHQPPGGFREYFAAACKTRKSEVWRAARQVFAPAVAEEMHDAFRDLLDVECSQYPNDEYGVWQFTHGNYFRNRSTVSRTNVFSNVALPFLVGLTKECFAKIATIPYETRRDGKVVMEVLEDHLPEVADVPVASFGQVFSRNRLLSPYVVARRYARALLRKAGRNTGFNWQPSRVAAKTISLIDPDHPELNGAIVRALQDSLPNPDADTATYRELLFYWQVWRWIMEGKLPALRAELLASHVP